MEFEDSNKHGSLAPEILADYMKKHKINLPEDYQQYLLTHNGGTPNPKDFRISDEEGETDITDIHVMYGLNSGPDWQSLESHRLTFRGRMPTSVLPIGSDALGNQIVICCAGKHQETVWFWDHEQEAPWYRHWGNMTQIAKSWTNFLDLLFEYIDPDESEWEKLIRIRDPKLLHQYIANNKDLNLKDEHERTLIENCAISAADEFIVILANAGAHLGNSLEIAKLNLKVGFEGHQETVKLIRSLM